MTNTPENDFGFTTLSADDYANLNKPATTTTVSTASVDLTPIRTQIDVLYTMVQALDDKTDGDSAKLDAILQNLGVVTTHITSNEDVPMVPRQRLVDMSKLILPLLYNLRDTAQNAYISWPNRAPVVQAQINQIEALLNA